jgi:hypothetical protein
MFKRSIGFFLSKWFFIAYFALGILHFVVYKLYIPAATPGKSFFMTLGLMTGSDPYSFKDVIEPYLFTWILAWVIHVGSWLLIPALIGLLVNDAAQEVRSQHRLVRALDSLLRDAGIEQDELSPITAELRSQIDKIAEKRRGE